jgi:hypothetical protein
LTLGAIRSSPPWALTINVAVMSRKGRSSIVRP